MSEASAEKWAGTKDVQEYLGVDRETISEWIARRGMRAYNVGWFWRFKIAGIFELTRTSDAAGPEQGEE